MAEGLELWKIQSLDLTDRVDSQGASVSVCYYGLNSDSKLLPLYALQHRRWRSRVCPPDVVSAGVASCHNLHAHTAWKQHDCSSALRKPQLHARRLLTLGRLTVLCART